MKVHIRILLTWSAVVAIAVGVALAQGAGSQDPAQPAAAQEADTAAQDDPLFQVASGLFAPLPDVMDDAVRPVTDEKVELGRMLWYDTRLSLSGGFSCNSCHNLATYGVDNLPTSLGHGWSIGPRNAPTALNAALHATQFWDGRAADVEAQAQGPILNPIEMGTPSAEFAVERIGSIPRYVELFEACHDGPALGPSRMNPSHG